MFGKPRERKASGRGIALIFTAACYKRPRERRVALRHRCCVLFAGRTYGMFLLALPLDEFETFAWWTTEEIDNFRSWDFGALVALRTWIVDLLTWKCFLFADNEGCKIGLMKGLSDNPIIWPNFLWRQRRNVGHKFGWWEYHQKATPLTTLREAWQPSWKKTIALITVILLQWSWNPGSCCTQPWSGETSVWATAILEKGRLHCSLSCVVWWVSWCQNDNALRKHMKHTCFKRNIFLEGWAGGFRLALCHHLAHRPSPSPPSQFHSTGPHPEPDEREQLPFWKKEDSIALCLAWFDEKKTYN